ncbi:hypothetical protein ATL39_0167 [Sinobaca qinghaiensis]|uniref:Uncharacterized protein n=1 Tax=Sinobaca qinghaiensis TaxID=342944 RepID=A0A419V7B6_9BACL|nr:hypothetical protein [Sinobaca qinghaiensis]RKD75957.1 hypothetical protein ATL39_0167 [Sinobaca qinghaiensis]
MGTLLRPFMMAFVFLIILVTEAVRNSLGYSSLLADDFPVWILYAGVILMIFSIVFSFYIRERTVKRHEEIIKEGNDVLSLGEGEFFYQAPLYRADRQRIQIHGRPDILYSLHFNNTFEKWFAIIVPLPVYGIHLRSEQYDVKIRCNKLFSFKYRYSIYINGKYFGRFSNHRLTSKKGISQFLPFYVETEQHHYNVNNSFGELTTSIFKDDQKELLRGERSLFDLKKSQKTNLRGEKHEIEVIDNEEPAELWLAVYALCMIFKDKSSG